MNDKIINNDQLSDALNGVADRHIRKNELDLLVGGESGGKNRSAKKLRVALTAACAAAVFGIGMTAGAAVTNGFTSGFTKVSGYDERYDQPTVKFSAASTQGAPEVIEQTYALGALPDGVNYRIVPHMSEDGTHYSVNYVQKREDAVNEPFYTMNMIQLIQETKAEFNDTFRTPKYVDVKEITVGGCPGYAVAEEEYRGRLNIIIWDNGEYIFRLWCILPEADAVKLAESLVPTGEVLV